MRCVAPVGHNTPKIGLCMYQVCRLIIVLQGCSCVIGLAGALIWVIGSSICAYVRAWAETLFDWLAVEF